MSAEVAGRLEKVFEGNCLPQTIGLARQFQAIVLRKLPPNRAEWPFEDRILVWLVPHLVDEGKAFHESGGPDMASIFESHQLEHFDEVLPDELRRKLGVEVGERPHPGRR